jgi:FMN phosphatase YigB (HAD superfamily)
MKKYLIFDLDGTLIQSQTWINKLIHDFFEANEPEYTSTSDYIFSTTQWTPLKEQLILIFWEKQKEKVEYFTANIYQLIREKWSHTFFPWVLEVVKKLSQDYTLFLTTGNSTPFATEVLKDGWIYECFEKVLGSDEILKGKPHLEIFRELSWDEEFYSHAIYTGDGPSDRAFAKEARIDFIHIWNEWKDVYEILSVKDIEPIIEQIKGTSAK